MIKIIIILLMTQLSYAFTLNSTTNPNFKGWNKSEIQFAINSTNCPASINITNLMEESFKVWNSVATSKLKLKVVGTTTSTTLADPVTVYCEPNFGSVIGDINSIPGAAQVSPSGNYATAGLITLNVSSGLANIANYDSNMLKITLAHEVGHILGLGHSHDRSALMYFDGTYYVNMSLGQDDVDGITYLYPRNELSGDKALGCAMIKNINNNNRNPLFGLIALLLPLLIYMILLLRSRYSKIVLNFN